MCCGVKAFAPRLQHCTMRYHNVNERLCHWPGTDRRARQGKLEKIVKVARGGGAYLRYSVLRRAECTCELLQGVWDRVAGYSVCWWVAALWRFCIHASGGSHGFTAVKATDERKKGKSNVPVVETRLIRQGRRGRGRCICVMAPSGDGGDMIWYRHPLCWLVIVSPHRK